MALLAYGVTLAQVTSFDYLWQVLTSEDDNWLAVLHNLWRAKYKWARLTRVLSREGADARTLGHIYLAVVQSVIIYGSGTWVPKPRMKRVLGGFHHRVARRLAGRQPRRGRQ